MADDTRQLHVADTERTDPDFSGTLAIGAHPDGELTFEDGVAMASAEVAETIVDRHPNIELGEAVVTADVDEGDEDEDEPTPEAEDESGPPFDPSDESVDDLRDKLDAGDYDVDELEALRAAETTGDNRTTALEAIDDALDAAEA
ncbi:hypothetical protein DJ71_22110 [Halorubrum sp. E3]|nr:hypothetical protein DJ71_22110 [Halorubrum sp. E3]